MNAAVRTLAGQCCRATPGSMAPSGDDDEDVLVGECLDDGEDQLVGVDPDRPLGDVDDRAARGRARPTSPAAPTPRAPADGGRRRSGPTAAAAGRTRSRATQPWSTRSPRSSSRTPTRGDGPRPCSSADLLPPVVDICELPAHRALSSRLRARPRAPRPRPQARVRTAAWSRPRTSRTGRPRSPPAGSRCARRRAPGRTAARS